MSINAPSLNYIFLNNLKSPKENTNYSDGFVYLGCIQQICDEQRRANEPKSNSNLSKRQKAKYKCDI